jgi:hypothetical protein
MKLTETFWKLFELDLAAEIKLSYLNWALNQARKPLPKYRHLFLWEDQKHFCIVNSKYGRAFAISPFGVGVRGFPKSKTKGIPSEHGEDITITFSILILKDPQ